MADMRAVFVGKGFSLLSAENSFRIAHKSEIAGRGRLTNPRGVRKIQWAAEGRGKRGGLRVIYYLLRARGQIWMLTVYGKNVRETIAAHLLRQMKEEAIDDAKDD